MRGNFIRPHKVMQTAMHERVTAMAELATLIKLSSQVSDQIKRYITTNRVTAVVSAAV